MASAGKAPWPFNWNPEPDEFGTMFQSIATALAFAGPALVGTATTDVYIGIPRSKKFFVAGANMTGAVAFAGGSTITATLYKNSTALTGAYDVKAATSGNNVDVPITAADVDRVVSPGDTLFWRVIAATTITTEGDLRGVVELSLMK
jgi:hypothetical protein